MYSDIDTLESKLVGSFLKLLNASHCTICNSSLKRSENIMQHKNLNINVLSRVIQYVILLLEGAKT